LKLHQPLVSHHLGLLRKAEAVTCTRFGKNVFYSLAADVKVTSESLQIGPVEITRKNKS
jgi:hypothetical protein